MANRAMTGDEVKEILTKHGYVPNPEPFVSPQPVEEDNEKAWIDVNALAVRQGSNKDEVPDFPIRITFKKVPQPLGYVDYVVANVRELNEKEASASKALHRQPDEKKKFGPWPRNG